MGRGVRREERKNQKEAEKTRARDKREGQGRAQRDARREKQGRGGVDRRGGWKHRGRQRFDFDLDYEHDVMFKTFWRKQHEVRAKVRANVWHLDPRCDDDAWLGVHRDETSAMIEKSLEPVAKAIWTVLVDGLVAPFFPLGSACGAEWYYPEIASVGMTVYSFRFGTLGFFAFFVVLDAIGIISSKKLKAWGSNERKDEIWGIYYAIYYFALGCNLLLQLWPFTSVFALGVVIRLYPLYLEHAGLWAHFRRLDGLIQDAKRNRVSTRDAFGHWRCVRAERAEPQTRASSHESRRTHGSGKQRRVPGGGPNGSHGQHDPPQPGPPYVGPKKRDPFVKLGLTPSGRGVVPDEVNKAYKVLAMRHHPGACRGILLLFFSRCPPSPCGRAH